jgi:hypothetical protein
MRGLRQQAIDRGVGAAGGFRWRGGEVSRIEGFSDAVFAFATTLLVVSLEVPRSFDDLIRTMQDFPAFGICFALLILIWHSHYTFFRRYGMDDGLTIAINSLLLFLVLFYVYPLKFLFSNLLADLLGIGPSTAGGLTPGQGRILLLVYGGGFVAVFLTLGSLYLHAWRQRERLGLDRLERYDTRTSIQHFGLMAAVGGLSFALAALAGSSGSFWAGMAYFLLGPVAGFHGAWRGRRRRALSRDD